MVLSSRYENMNGKEIAAINSGNKKATDRY